MHDTELARTIPNVYQVDEPPRAELADVCLVIQPDADRSAVSRRPLGSRKGPDDESSGEMASGHYDSAMAQMRYGPSGRVTSQGRGAEATIVVGIPISGDDEEAKRTVAALIDQIGFDPVDAGTLAGGGRKHQTGAPAYTQGQPTAELRARPAA